eukprot:CAMPEP_0204278296 /NCGR_PEP_ID=MMETSP0468-20130131/29782_1 /ASSEMBLY_ACC=CAM_ASM_000383 /TAXON_ID=2969 /ORGANISM="Oxyrrhis marina" /LENGTH=222 /DNA_ID=CAMNT_0051255181 /DNA_START=25 /DNA_END=693 /DNA_ORIENTATION=+
MGMKYVNSLPTMAGYATTVRGTFLHFEETPDSSMRSQSCGARMLFQEPVLEAWSENVTTVVIRNIPNLYTRDTIMGEIDELGFQGKYDFFYLPMGSRCNVGYAFINMLSNEWAQKFRAALHGKKLKSGRAGRKTIELGVAKIQGAEAQREAAVTVGKKDERGRFARSIWMVEELQDVPVVPVVLPCTGQGHGRQQRRDGHRGRGCIRSTPWRSSRGGALSAR